MRPAQPVGPVRADTDNDDDNDDDDDDDLPFLSAKVKDRWA